MNQPWPELGSYALRTLAVGVLIYAMSRYLPRRAGGALAAYDFVFFWMMGGLAVAPLYDLKIRVIDTAAAVATVYLCHYGLSGLAVANRRCATWLAGEPITVIEQGSIREERMERALLPLEILLSELRIAGAKRVAEVETAILETTGHLSVVKKAEHLPVTAGDLKLGQPDPPLPVVLVADGKVVRHNLNKLAVTEKWLRSQLSQAGAPEAEQIYAAIWEGTIPIYWAPKAGYTLPWHPP